MYPQYMCILLYVNHMWCNAIPLIYCHLECEEHVFSEYVHYAICEPYLV